MQTGDVNPFVACRVTEYDTAAPELKETGDHDKRTRPSDITTVATGATNGVKVAPANE